MIVIFLFVWYSLLMGGKNISSRRQYILISGNTGKTNTINQLFKQKGRIRGGGRRVLADPKYKNTPFDMFYVMEVNEDDLTELKSISDGHAIIKAAKYAFWGSIIVATMYISAQLHMHYNPNIPEKPAMEDNSSGEGSSSIFVDRMFNDKQVTDILIAWFLLFSVLLLVISAKELSYRQYKYDYLSL